MRALCVALLMGLSLSHAESEKMMKIGSPLPPLTAKDQDGKEVDLATYGKDGYLLVFLPQSKYSRLYRSGLQFA